MSINWIWYISSEMKRFLLLYLFVIVPVFANSQATFVKQIDNPNFGTGIRVVPASDGGWCIISKDSLSIGKFNSCGEPVWSFQYQLPNETSSLSDFIQTQDGGFIWLSRSLSVSGHGFTLTKINAAGNIVWSNSYAQIDYDYYPYTVNQDTQGNYVVFANSTQVSTNNVNNLICKINPAGAVINSQFYNYGGTWGGAIATSDGGVLFRTGSTLIKLTNNLAVQWLARIFAGTYNYFAPIEVSNGYVFSGYSNGGQLISYYKIDLNGNLLWGGSKQTNIVGTPKYLKKRANGNLASVFTDFQNGNSYTSIIEFSEEMDVISQSSFSNTSFVGTDMCFLPNGTPVVVGMDGSHVIYAKLNQAYKSGCDIDINPIQLTLNSITAELTSAIASNHSVDGYPSDYSSNPISLNTSTICTVPKILDLGNDTVLCDGATITLQNQTADLFDHYVWSNGSNASSITVSEPGRYWLLVYDDCDVNRSNDTIWIELLLAINADLGEDMLLCEEETRILFKPDCDNCQFVWSTGETTDSIVVNEKGIYWLEILNANGCSSTDSVMIDFGKCNCDFYVPNAFSPNDDGLNDVFSAKFDCAISEFSMLIYNRWGELIYSTTNPLQTWNAKINHKPVPSDVYTYRISYTPTYLGESTTPVMLNGLVTIIN